MLAESKVAGARVQNNVSAFGGELPARSTTDPSVFTNLKTDSDSTNFEQDITDRIFDAVEFDFSLDRTGPSFEPSRFIVDAVTGEVLFGDEARDLAVD